MRRRPLTEDEPFEELENMDFDPVSSAQKMPVNITNGMKPLTEFMEVPCDKLMSYQGKQESDFKEWPEEQFAFLVESVRANGVIEPITVRVVENESTQFEILAGEHRWKASVRVGLRTIPARVMRECDDQMAEAIFALTNILRRENSLLDKVNGWWHYLRIIRYKRKGEIEQLQQEGVLDTDLAAKAKETGERTIYRYAKLHDLIPEFKEMLEQNRLSITSGELLAGLSPEQQQDLFPYQEFLNDKGLIRQFLDLAQGKIEGSAWTKESLNLILYSQPAENPAKKTLRKAVGGVVQEMLPERLYHRADEIVRAALETYLKEHPELLEEKEP